MQKFVFIKSFDFLTRKGNLSSIAVKVIGIHIEGQESTSAEN